MRLHFPRAGQVQVAVHAFVEAGRHVDQAIPPVSGAVGFREAEGRRFLARRIRPAHQGPFEIVRAGFIVDPHRESVVRFVVGDQHGTAFLSADIEPVGGPVVRRAPGEARGRRVGPGGRLPHRGDFPLHRRPQVVGGILGGVVRPPCLQTIRDAREIQREGFARMALFHPCVRIRAGARGGEKVQTQPRAPRPEQPLRVVCDRRFGPVHVPMGGKQRVQVDKGVFFQRREKRQAVRPRVSGRFEALAVREHGVGGRAVVAAHEIREQPIGVGAGVFEQFGGKPYLGGVEIRLVRVFMLPKNPGDVAIRVKTVQFAVMQLAGIRQSDHVSGEEVDAVIPNVQAVDERAPTLDRRAVRGVVGMENAHGLVACRIAEPDGDVGLRPDAPRRQRLGV